MPWIRGRDREAKLKTTAVKKPPIAVTIEKGAQALTGARPQLTKTARAQAFLKKKLVWYPNIEITASVLSNPPSPQSWSPFKAHPRMFRPIPRTKS